MTKSLFLRLLKSGERSNIDYKLTCNAFNKAAGDCEKAKSELVKDICAMANNGFVASYIIVGVSDDRRSARPAAKLGLTPDNIQTLVRDAIQPRPFIRVHEIRWSDIPKPFSGIPIVVIQVGPTPRNAFRLARDSINHELRFHFRKNEVWVRNEATSDLATPEQIAALVPHVRKAEKGVNDQHLENVDYLKLKSSDQFPSLMADIKRFVAERGGKVSLLPKPERYEAGFHQNFRIQLPIRDRYYVFHARVLEKLTAKRDSSWLLPYCWLFEHGTILFVIGNQSASGMPTSLDPHIPTRWGALGQFCPRRLMGMRRKLGLEFNETRCTILTLKRLRDSNALRAAFSNLLEDFETDEVLHGHLRAARDEFHSEILKWSKRAPKTITRSFDQWNREGPAAFIRQIKSVIDAARPIKTRQI